MSQDESMTLCEKIFAKHLQGQRLLSNAIHIFGSAWTNSPRVLCEKWSHDNVVLMGYVLATANYSIGSGTKLAMGTAVALADYLHTAPTMASAFEKYEDARRLEELKLQFSARNSLKWFEDLERYLALDMVQCNYSLMTRSQRISHENLRCATLRVGNIQSSGLALKTAMLKHALEVRAPMFIPYKLRGMYLENRAVVLSMAQYKAENGCLTDRHLAHYGSLAKGGAKLVFVEMTCVSATCRITPDCPGLYTAEQGVVWRRITELCTVNRRLKSARKSVMQDQKVLLNWVGRR